MSVILISVSVEGYSDEWHSRNGILALISAACHLAISYSSYCHSADCHLAIFYSSYCHFDKCHSSYCHLANVYSSYCHFDKCHVAWRHFYSMSFCRVSSIMSFCRMSLC